MSSRSFVGVSSPPGDSIRAIITWLEVCRCFWQSLRLPDLIVPSQGLLAPPLDIYLQYQKMLLSAEAQEANDAIQVPTNLGLLTTEAKRLPPPTVMLDRAQSSVKYGLGCLQDYVATFIGWLLDT